MNQLLSSKRRWTHCSWDASDAAIDALCASCRQLRVAYGYLSMRASLLSNISVLENIWLPHAWRFGSQLDAIVARLKLISSQVNPGDRSPALMAVRDLKEWLNLRPAQLQSHQIEAAVVLRACLGSPVVIIIDPAWSNWDDAITLLSDATWWMPVGDPPEPPDVDWIHVSLTDALRLEF